MLMVRVLKMMRKVKMRMGWTRARRASWLVGQCQERRRGNRGSLNLSLNLFRRAINWSWQRSPSSCSGLQGSGLVWQGVNLWRRTGWWYDSFQIVRVKVVWVFSAVTHGTRVQSPLRFYGLTERMGRMEATIGPILNKLDSVLLRCNLTKPNICWYHLVIHWLTF